MDDLLYDVDYMQEVIKRTDEVIAQKRETSRNWKLVQRWIILFLVVEALFGIFIALYKTVLQSDYVVMVDQFQQPVDLAFLVDSSSIMKNQKGSEENTVKTFATEFKSTLDEIAKKRASDLAKQEKR